MCDPVMHDTYATDIDETIAAVSTAPGAALRGIARLSGPRAVELALGVFRPRLPGPVPRFGVMGGSVRLAELSGELPAELYSMRAPNSYTRQDVMEIHTLGAPVVLKTILAAFVASGARPARAGEFTLRAFLNGRIDLAQAEAVARITYAASAQEALAAARLLAGGVSEPLARARDELIRIRSLIELGLDFSDQDVPVVDPSRLGAELRAVADDLARLLGKAVPHTADALPRVLLFGLTNAGKSTLFNRMCGQKRVVVSASPGTTRDLIEVPLAFDGVQAVLVDAAGQRDRSGELGASAGAKAAAAAASSDLVVHVLDPTRPVSPQIGDFADIDACRKLLAVNKIDLLDETRLKCIRDGLADRQPVLCSARRGDGVRTLVARIAQALREGSPHDAVGVVLVSVRQRDLAGSARDAVLRAAAVLDDGWGEEVAALECAQAVEALDAISGRDVSDDVLNSIFANFCIGK